MELFGGVLGPTYNQKELKFANTQKSKETDSLLESPEMPFCQHLDFSPVRSVMDL